MELKTVEERFLEKVDKSPGHGPYGDCYLWTGPPDLSVGGYGNFWDGENYVGAHRFAFKLHYGTYPEHCALHNCDTPLCVNGAHLYDGTKLDNIRDRVKRDRSAKGVYHGLAKVTEKDVRWARQNARGLTQTQMAEVLGISTSTMSQIINHQTWKHVLDKDVPT